MKRKGRKPKNKEEDQNGIEREEQNGDTSEREEQEMEEPESKRNKKSNKRKSASKKAEESKKTEESTEEESYEVEQVLDEKMIRGTRHYLIRWKGYEPESDTWEPESTLNCPELIADFKAKQKKKGKSPKKKKSGASIEETWDENENFEVERILDVYFKKNGKREFLVSWKGYPTSQNSWEPEENMDCKDLIKKFMDKVDRAKNAGERELRINPAHTDRLTLLSDGHLGRRLSKRNLGKQRVHYHDAE